MINLLRNLFLVLLLLGVGAAWAQDAPAMDFDSVANRKAGDATKLPEAKNFPKQILTAALNGVGNIFNADAACASDSSGATCGLHRLGFKLIWVFSIGGVCLAGLKVVLGASDMMGLFVDLLKIGVIGAISMSAFHPTPASDYIFGSGVTLGDFIANGFFSLSGVDPGSFIASTAGAWFRTIGAVWSLPVVPPSVDGWAVLFWVIGNIIDILFVLGMKVLVTVAMVALGVLTMGHMLMGKLQIALALYLAPLLAPFLMFGPFNHLFDGWIRSIISGGMTIFVGTLFARGGLAFVESIDGLFKMLPMGSMLEVFFAPTEVNLIYLGLLFGTILFILVALRLDSLASAVLSGSGVRGFSFNDMKSALKSGGMGAVKSAAGAAGGALAASYAGSQGVKAAQAALASSSGGGGGSGGGSGGRSGAAAPRLSSQQAAAAYMAAKDSFNSSRARGIGLGTSLRASNKAGSNAVTAPIAKQQQSAGQGGNGQGPRSGPTGGQAPRPTPSGLGTPAGKP